LESAGIALVCADPKRRSLAPTGTCLKKTTSWASASSVRTSSGLGSKGASWRGSAVFAALVIHPWYSPSRSQTACSNSGCTLLKSKWSTISGQRARSLSARAFSTMGGELAGIGGLCGAGDPSLVFAQQVPDGVQQLGLHALEIEVEHDQRPARAVV